MKGTTNEQTNEQAIGKTMGKMDRRHDINAGEALPQRFTRVEDDDAYKANIKACLDNKENWARLDEEERKARVIENIEQGQLVYVPGLVRFMEAERVDATTVWFEGHPHGREGLRLASPEFVLAYRLELERLGVL